jgi:3-ketosteroid 9alpha-monooxygenase subunit A
MNDITTVDRISTGDELERCPMPIPFGWFIVALSEDVKPGDIQTVFVFGKEWVLFRNESGEIGMTDPFCPHLGAHIGHGGKIIGDHIRCPFHHWEFDPQGWAKKIPYAKVLPGICKRKPVLKALPTQERYGAIFAWYHPFDEEPKFGIKEIPELDAAMAGDGYVPIDRKRFDIPTMMQEASENGVDHLHLYYLHGNPTMPPPPVVTINGIEHIKDNLDGFIIAENYGPGSAVVRFTKEGVSMTAGVFSTPITNDRSETRWFYTFMDYPEGTAERKMAERLKAMSFEADPEDEQGAGFETVDILIWTHKKYRPKPLLVEGDGPILQFREWYKQFYAEPLPEVATG